MRLTPLHPPPTPLHLPTPSTYIPPPTLHPHHSTSHTLPPPNIQLYSVLSILSFILFHLSPTLLYSFYPQFYDIPSLLNYIMFLLYLALLCSLYPSSPILRCSPSHHILPLPLPCPAPYTCPGHENNVWAANTVLRPLFAYRRGT